jgi:hypothetical protein
MHEIVMNRIVFLKNSAAFDALGRTNHKRARALARPLRTFMDWKPSKLPLHGQHILQPSLLRALADDINASQEPQPLPVSRQIAA